MNFRIRFSFYFKQGTCLLSFALWWIALNLNQRECTVWFDLIRLLCAYENYFYMRNISFFKYIYYWGIEFWSHVRNVGSEVEGWCFVHTSIKKCPWVTLQGSRIVLVIYQATLKRDIIATVYDLRRSSSSNRSSKTSPLANPKSQTKICYLSVQANKLIGKYTVLY